MKISALIKILGSADKPREDFEIKGVTCNSKEVKKDFLFIAVKGAKEDGSKFISEAVKNGARVIVSSDSKFKKEGVVYLKVSDTRKAAAAIAAEFYHHPAEKLEFIGVTGTNGKTTVTYLIESILQAAGRIPAVIGTVNYRYKNKIIPAKNTTPGPVELEKLFSDFVASGVTHVVMEVSSHALAQGRTDNIRFHTGIFTNLTQDHLDYHQTKEKYFLAKLRLFKNLTKNAWAVINRDDPYYARIKKNCPANILTYALDHPAELSAYGIEYNSRSTNFRVRFKNISETITTSLAGRHNVYNILAAMGACFSVGVKFSIIKKGIESFKFVPGRLQRIDAKKGFSIFVDYAHTDDALKNVITTLRQVVSGRIIVVFGCGGDRDRGKRPKMGSVVSRLADYAIITNDNPRSEIPADIAKDIICGMKSSNFEVILDRKQAIKKGITLAEADDVLLIAGKGHENYQIIKNRVIEFDDCQVVKECL